MSRSPILKIIFYVLCGILFFAILFYPVNTESIPKEPIKNQSMTKVKNWGYTDDYCLQKLRMKDGTIIQIPRCEF